MTKQQKTIVVFGRKGGWQNRVTNRGLSGIKINPFRFGKQNKKNSIGVALVTQL